ncbi:cellulose synthase complex outer membrane protein BcsC [Limnobaculum parvum]|uniref:Cellulose biosynthesis protein BcsC n=1 Tax=Limnobaculum parvum TaxID=2172103 RepID=A0A2Y9U2J3_9GAMM|nr:cellulose biosynthesis protein BcsC [Limnobaculum parvum]
MKLYHRFFPVAGIAPVLSFTLLPFTLSPVGVLAADSISPEAWLQEQIRIGESTHRDDLVKASLYRLEKISPNAPETLAAQIRYALRQGDMTTATRQLEQLRKLQPDSEAYLSAKLQIALAQPEGKSKLQQARLLATGGQLAQAKAAYDELFEGHAPTLELDIEYWNVVLKIPGQQDYALQQMQALQKRFPSSDALNMSIAQLLFDEGKDQQAYQVLETLAASPGGIGSAAELWYSKLKEIPVSDRSVAQLQHFVTTFEGQPTAVEAKQELIRQQTQLQDPRYRARVRGLEQVDSGDGLNAIPSLKQALSASPNDAELLTALGQAYARAGNRQQALTQFEKAKANDITGDYTAKLDSLIKTNRYWLTIERADNALKNKRLDQAETLYRQASAIDGTDAQGLIGLGDVEMARNNTVAAESYYKKAQHREPDSGSAVSALVSLYEKQSPEKALSYIQSLPGYMKNRMRSSLNELTASSLKQQAEELAAAGKPADAEAKYLQVQKITPDDVWLTYRLAGVMRTQGKNAQADTLFSRAMLPHQRDAGWIYAYSLYLSGSGRETQALAQLQTLDRTAWDDNIRALDTRLKTSQILQQAQQIRETEGEPAAITWLQQQPASTRIDLTLAGWAIEREDGQQAQAQYQKILAREPNNQDALLGVIDAQITEGDLNAAKASLEALSIQPQASDIATGRRLAYLWSLVGDDIRAGAILTPLKSAALLSSTEPSTKPSMDNARLWRDVAAFDERTGHPDEALNDYRHAMTAYGITPSAEMDDEALTKAMRHDRQDDWLKRGIKSDAESLYKQQSTTVTLDHDYWGSSGTKGISDLTAHTTMLHIAFPLQRGTAFLRGDSVMMDAGSFSTDSRGVYNETFGTCREVGCSDERSQKDNGVSVATGWQDDNWQIDIGTTPMGFEVVDWVGGIGYSNDWHNLGWTVTASRRPISSSLLSFGGAVDPYTGTQWGGVRKNGVQLDLSYDRGGPNGVWGNVAYHQLTGKNVADNQRMQAMTGYYYKVINENDRQVRVGLNTLWWHYQKDLSDYTLGQGGYYSPQQYLSFSLPLLYRERTENWSWELGGSVSLSHSSTDSSKRYPLQGLIPDSLPDKYDTNDSSSSSGTGYTLRALVERRITSHWSVGAGVDIQQAKDYTPSHALIYVRYALEPWLGDMDLPPQPLTPYADFK